MIKRTFRFGVLVGLLIGAAAALVKLLGGRPEGAALPATVAPSAPWPRLEEDPTLPAAPGTSLVHDPDAPAQAPAATPSAPASPAAPSVPAAKRPPRTAPMTAAPEPAAEAPVDVPPEPGAKAAAKKGAAKRQAPVRAWVEPEGDVCPTTHPIKAKLASKIFHQPGMLNYGRTRPDRCYLNEASAEADGLRPAKR
ncbi:MAG TPA: hypothetical protein VFV32_10130 [Acidimicrobiales bacterium]|nr:hypothetical protein [Acidimicrobiales bacterium]